MNWLQIETKFIQTKIDKLEAAEVVTQYWLVGKHGKKYTAMNAPYGESVKRGGVRGYTIVSWNGQLTWQLFKSEDDANQWISDELKKLRQELEDVTAISLEDDGRVLRDNQIGD